MIRPFWIMLTMPLLLLVSWIVIHDMINNANISTSQPQISHNQAPSRNQDFIIEKLKRMPKISKHSSTHAALLTLMKNSKQTPSPNPRLPRTELPEMIKESSQAPTLPIEVYEFATKQLRYYQSIRHMNHIHFAGLLNKAAAPYVSAKIVCHKRCRTLKGELSEMQKYFVYSQTPMFQSSFWILIAQTDLIHFFKELGYKQIIVGNDENLLFRQM